MDKWLKRELLGKVFVVRNHLLQNDIYLFVLLYSVAGNKN